jgi:starvation-inducible DNA-binding protein
MNTRRTEAEVAGFHASPELSENLQQVLVDLIELHLQGKQAHWNVIGTNFRDLHLQLDELVDFAREGSDTIAERMRALDAVPDGRSDTVAAATTLPDFPAYEHSTTEVVDLITARTYAAVDTGRSEASADNLSLSLSVVGWRRSRGRRPGRPDRGRWPRYRARWARYR